MKSRCKKYGIQNMIELLRSIHDENRAYAAAPNGDPDAPFKSVDARTFYLEYCIHFNSVIEAGAVDWRDLFWDRAVRELQGEDFNELFDRVLLLKASRALDELITKVSEERSATRE